MELIVSALGERFEVMSIKHLALRSAHSACSELSHYLHGKDWRHRDLWKTTVTAQDSSLKHLKYTDGSGNKNNV